MQAGTVRSSPHRRHWKPSNRSDAAAGTVWVTGCQSWYLDNDDIPAGWTMSYERFREAMAAPDPADFVTR